MPYPDYVEDYNVRTRMLATATFFPPDGSINVDITDGLDLKLTLIDDETDEPIAYTGDLVNPTN